MKTLKYHREKMRVCVNVHMSKIMHAPIKVGIHMYVTYANCQGLLKDDFIMYYFLQGPQIVKIINCFFPLVLSTRHN